MKYDKCPICSSKSKEIFDPSKGSYFSCETCNFIYKNREEIISIEKEKHIYDQHHNSIDQEGYVNFLYGFLHNALFPFIKETKRGLDFGSGPTPVLAEILQQYHGCFIDIYDLFYAPIKVYLNKKYDFITSTEVLEHLLDPMSYFNMFYDLLNDNGVLAIMTLFHPNDDEKFLDWHYRRDWSHVSFYSIETMEYIAEQTGFEVIYTNNHRYITFKKK